MSQNTELKKLDETLAYFKRYSEFDDAILLLSQNREYLKTHIRNADYVAGEYCLKERQKLAVSFVTCFAVVVFGIAYAFLGVDKIIIAGIVGVVSLIALIVAAMELTKSAFKNKLQEQDEINRGLTEVIEMYGSRSKQVEEQKIDYLRTLERKNMVCIPVKYMKNAEEIAGYVRDGKVDIATEAIAMFEQNQMTKKMESMAAKKKKASTFNNDPIPTRTPSTFAPETSNRSNTGKKPISMPFSANSAADVVKQLSTPKTATTASPMANQMARTTSAPVTNTVNQSMAKAPVSNMGQPVGEKKESPFAFNRNKPGKKPITLPFSESSAADIVKQLSTPVKTTETASTPVNQTVNATAPIPTPVANTINQPMAKSPVSNMGQPVGEKKESPFAFNKSKPGKKPISLPFSQSSAADMVKQLSTPVKTTETASTPVNQTVNATAPIPTPVANAINQPMAKAPVSNMGQPVGEKKESPFAFNRNKPGKKPITLPFSQGSSGDKVNAVETAPPAVNQTAATTSVPVTNTINQPMAKAPVSNVSQPAEKKKESLFSFNRNKPGKKSISLPFSSNKANQADAVATQSAPTPDINKPITPAYSEPTPVVNKSVTPAYSEPTPVINKPVTPVYSEPTPVINKPVTPAYSEPTPVVNKPVTPAYSEPTPVASRPSNPFAAEDEALSFGKQKTSKKVINLPFSAKWSPSIENTSEYVQPDFSKDAVAKSNVSTPLTVKKNTPIAENIELLNTISNDKPEKYSTPPITSDSQPVFKFKEQ